MSVYDDYLLNTAKRIPSDYFKYNLWQLENFDIWISKFTVWGPTALSTPDREDEIWRALNLIFLACLFNSPDLAADLKNEFLKEYSVSLDALKRAVLIVAKDHAVEVIEEIKTILDIIGDTPYRVDGDTLTWNWIAAVISGKAINAVEEITIPEKVRYINPNAFAGAIKLTTVTFEPGSKLKYLSYQTFSDCKNLKTINFSGTKKEWEKLYGIPDWNKWLPRTCKIYCTDGIIDL